MIQLPNSTFAAWNGKVMGMPAFCMSPDILQALPEHLRSKL
jgi:hypothetical protein